MNDIKYKLITSNLLPINNEETFNQISSSNNSPKKEEAFYFDTFFDKNSNPTLHSTQQAKKSNNLLGSTTNTINNSANLPNKNQITLHHKKSFTKTDSKKISHSNHKIKIPTSNSKSPSEQTPIKTMKLDVKNNHFFNKKAPSSNPDNIIHINAKKKLFNLSVKDQKQSNRNNNAPNKLKPRQNSNDVPTRSDSISNNNSRKNTDQTLAFSPLYKPFKKNKSFYLNEQSENNATQTKQNEIQKKTVKNIKLFKSKTKKVGGLKDNKKKIQILFESGNNKQNSNNNLNKLEMNKKEIENENITSELMIEPKIDIKKKKGFLCCIPLFKVANKKKESS